LRPGERHGEEAHGGENQIVARAGAGVEALQRVEVQGRGRARGMRVEQGDGGEDGDEAQPVDDEERP